MRLFRAMSRKMSQKKCSSRLVAAALLLAAALTLAVPASAEWKEKVLYSFQGGTSDGSVPAGGVVFDSQGNLYGVLQDYGPPSCAPIGNQCGAVFQLAPPVQKGGAWTETLIYKFQGKGSNDGESPNGGLIIDSQGNLYGVTAYGGTGNCVLLGVSAGCGTVYELSPPKQKGGAWKKTILYSFPTSKQGYLPNGNLVFDGAGNLYGATTFGGTKGTTCDAFYGGECGVVFELSPPKTKGGKWTEKVLHNFAAGTDGANPNGGLEADNKGTLYGTTATGGNQLCRFGNGDVGCGTVFKLFPPTRQGELWTEKLVRAFKGNPGDGDHPNSGVVLDSKGRLFGTTVGGGDPSGDGTVYRLASSNKILWKETLLQTFKNSGDPNGANPMAPLLLDPAGNIYGTTNAAGGHFGGTVFRLMRMIGGGWNFELLYSFSGPPDGQFPAAPLVFGATESLYGTTSNGGTGAGCEGGCGTVFKLWPLSGDKPD
jgi:uncharacterized repeat protein (TIGR03803 family)